MKAKRRMLGNIRFIGELYKKRMLKELIMHECIRKLLGLTEDQHARGKDRLKVWREKGVWERGKGGDIEKAGRRVFSMMRCGHMYRHGCTGMSYPRSCKRLISSSVVDVVVVCSKRRAPWTRRVWRRCASSSPPSASSSTTSPRYIQSTALSWSGCQEKHDQSIEK